MEYQQTNKQEPEISGDCATVINHLRGSLETGTYWAVAILEAIALWPLAVEHYHGRNLQYLIGNEAFDWKLLAERLCIEMKSLIPHTELNQLSSNHPYPPGIDESEFRRLIGPDKYRAHLNFWYGIRVEEALIKAVKNEIIKEHHARGLSIKKDYLDEAYVRIYGKQKRELLNSYQQEHQYPEQDTLTSIESKAFTYWLFKHRINTTEPARVASDTRKGLEHLQRLHHR